MSATLKLGNSNWGTKEDSLLAYSDQYNNFQPLPFDFTRASSATVVNKAGLIETVQSGIPRIDFSDDVNGALLLEPQRTNLFTYSDDFSNAYWSKLGATVVTGQPSPSVDSPTGAYKLVESGISELHAVFNNGSVSLAVGKKTLSVYVKANGRDYVQLRTGNTSAIDSAPLYANFDLTNGTVSAQSVGADFATIKTLTNDWFKISITFTVNTTTGAALVVQPISTQTAVIAETYLGDGTSGIYIFGAQIEASSYPTSYIPTQGSTVTRNLETCTGAGNDQVFNSVNSSGVLFVESSTLTDLSSGDRTISINDGLSNSKYVLIQFRTDGKIWAFIKGGTAISYEADLTEYHKIGVRWNSDLTFDLYVDGVLRASSTYAALLTNLSEVSFVAWTTIQNFYGNTKDVQVLTHQTDAEMISLTSL